MIGIIKITGTEKVREGTRVEFLCGGRALGDYGEKHGLLAALGSRMSTDWRELGGITEKLVAENKSLRRERDALSRELAGYRAAEIGKPTGGIGGFGLVRKVFDEASAGDVREMATRIKESGGNIVLFGIISPAPGLGIRVRSVDTGRHGSGPERGRRGDRRKGRRREGLRAGRGRRPFEDRRGPRRGREEDTGDARVTDDPRIEDRGGREEMVRTQIAGRDISDVRILDAMRKVPRELFVRPGGSPRRIPGRAPLDRIRTDDLPAIYSRLHDRTARNR